MVDKLDPPEFTRRIENCKYRVAGDQCCNARNPLRPHICNGYCVEKLHDWLLDAHPQMKEDERLSIIIELTETTPD